MRIVHPFLCALQFLTRVPLALRTAPSAGDLRWAPAYYSVVGLLIGGGAAAVYRASVAILPSSVSTLLALLFLVAITGALHEDGLADCADGFGAARERERILEIMRDSRIGTFGALAVVFAVLLKYALLTSLGQGDVLGALVLAPVLSRWLVLPLTIASRPARPDGLGSVFSRSASTGPMLVAAVPVIVIGGWILQLSFVVVAAGASVAVALFGWYCHRRIGGITGDCLGAAIQFAEIATYVGIVALGAS